MLSKVGSFQASLFEDWRGYSYIGLRGKAGDMPDLVLDADTGEIVEGITELDDFEIITALMNDSFYIDMFTQNPEEIEMLLYAAFEKQAAQTDAFWNAVNELLPDIEDLDENEFIDADGKFINIIRSVLNRVVQAVVNLFTGVDEKRYFINKYTTYQDSFRGPETGSIWCGPWLVSYLEWIRNGRTGNTYDDALKYSNSIVGTVFTGKPMLPSDMNRALQFISGNQMSMANIPTFDSILAYNSIKMYSKPVALAAVVGIKDKERKSGHWLLAVGARASGSVLWQTHHFLFHENNTEGMNGIDRFGELSPSFNNSYNTNRRDQNSQYLQVPVWVPWYFVFD